MERVIFNNLAIAVGEGQFLLMNLASFRRQIISSEEYRILQTAWGKKLSDDRLEDNEKKLIHKLRQDKQILTKEEENKYFSSLENESSGIEAPFPVRGLSFNITHQCSFSCDYCYQRLYNRLPEYAGRMTCDDIDKIALYLQNNTFYLSELEEITISGGEPLLNGNEDVINYILERFPAKEVVLFTNGIGIERFKSKVNYNKITKFQVSLDGPDETIRQVNHSSAQMKTILDGIDFLLSQGKKVSLAVVWTKSLEQNLESFISTIEQTGFCNSKDFSINVCTVSEYSRGDLIDKNFYDWEYLFRCEKKYAELLSKVKTKLQVCTEIVRLRNVLLRPFNERVSPKTASCNAKETLPLIFEPNGEIHWCLCLGKEQGTLGNYKTGIIMEERIKALANRNIFTIPKCRECAFKYLCGGGCVLNCIGSDTPINAPFCNIYQDKFFWDHLEVVL